MVRQGALPSPTPLLSAMQGTCSVRSRRGTKANPAETIS